VQHPQRLMIGKQTVALTLAAIAVAVTAVVA
jgi:hypothetical protein